MSKKLKHLSRYADLTNPESVLKLISSKDNPNTKSLLANAYGYFAEYYNIQSGKPVYRKSDSPIKVP